MFNVSEPSQPRKKFNKKKKNNQEENAKNIKKL